MKTINKITIIEDHPLMIKGVKELIRIYMSDIEFYEFKSPVDFLKKASSNDSDLIILDIDFNNCDIDGFYLLSELNKRNIDIPVIVYTFHDSHEYIAKSINLGAKAHISKNNIEEELVEAIEAIKSDLIYIPKNLSKNFSLTNKGMELNLLSKREKEVFLLLEEGYKNVKIAQKLNISPNSVTTYKKRILDKLSYIKY